MIICCEYFSETVGVNITLMCILHIILAFLLNIYHH